MSILYNRLIGELEFLNDTSTAPRYIPVYPQYYRLFTPLAYYYSPIAQYSEMDWQVPHYQVDDVLVEEFKPIDNTSLTGWDSSKPLVNEALMYVYMSNPNLVVTTEDNIMSRQVFREEVAKAEVQKDKVMKLFQKIGRAHV